MRRVIEVGWTHALTLSVQQIRRKRSLLDRTVVLLLDVALVMRLERLLHLNLLLVTLRVMHLRLVSDHLLVVRRRLVHLSSFTFPPICRLANFSPLAKSHVKSNTLSLLVVHSPTMALAVLFHILILIFG